VAIISVLIGCVLCVQNSFGLSSHHN